jgi:hypothetical protein
MTYKTYHQLSDDLEYLKEMEEHEKFSYRHSRYGLFITYHMRKKVMKTWMDRIKEKYNETSKSNSALGKFLLKYPL